MNSKHATRARFWPQGFAHVARSLRKALHISCGKQIGGKDLREIVTLEHESRITFFQADGPREGAIINELYEDEDGALHIRFYCYMGLRAKQPNGREEQTEQAQLASEHGYKAALLSTLKRTRELLAEGTL
ncbi:uncharacterized protein DUF1857 [Rhizobium azibense]|uniref:Uncharacterized protein DUF1857 n=1 Tax=Rhizobium azibense TaxID=1136135 RepID=A0A4R3QTD0_9HYPH|nr:uncharacterized protein DUF1857 [Rhizobium azibense]